MKTIVINKKDDTLQATYEDVINIRKQDFDDTGKCWVLVLESKKTSDPEPDVTATFPADEWEIFCEKTW